MAGLLEQQTPGPVCRACASAELPAPPTYSLLPCRCALEQTYEDHGSASGGRSSCSGMQGKLFTKTCKCSEMSRQCYSGLCVMQRHWSTQQDSAGGFCPQWHRTLTAAEKASPAVPSFRRFATPFFSACSFLRALRRCCSPACCHSLQRFGVSDKIRGDMSCTPWWLGRQQVCCVGQAHSGTCKLPSCQC